MKFDLKKINFKQPKYFIPMLALIPLLFIGYQVTTMFDDLPEDTDQPVITESLNTDLPDIADNSETGNKSKYQAMLDGFGKVTDYSGVSGVESEAELGLEADQVYNDAEKNRIDSLMAIQQAEADRLKRELERRQQEWQQQREQRERNVVSRGRAEADDDWRQRERESEEQDYNDMVRRMQLIQKVQNGEKILTDEDKQRELERKAALAERKRVLDSIAAAQAPVAVNKAGMGQEQYFNTVAEDNGNPQLIRARVDGLVKAKDGSRIRLRLSEDIEIEGERVPEGTYLYATVTGFSAQRVKATVQSAKLGNSIKRIKLSVYDLDGMEGFYVPSSNFREVTKDVGSGAMQLNMNMSNSSGDMDLESMAMQSLQQALQSTTQAISKSIRANRARIKSYTEIYLMDTSEN